jgi:4-amino-4-deoxy-L-arabinose transferase-like glycosyltransferase
LKKASSLDSLASDERVHLVLLILFSLTIFFAKLGLNGMANFDDCFYAEKAKEILKNGHWMAQTFNYQLDFQNPPLFMILEALAYKVFGVGVYAAKFPSALMGFFTVLVTYFLGRRLFNPGIGFFAGFILASTYPFFKYGRHAMLDVTLGFFVTLAMASLWLAVKKDRRYFWLWGLAIGLAILTKSALGLFAVIVTVLFLALTKRWKTCLNPHLWGGVVVFTAITLYWVACEYAAGGPQFIEVQWRNVILKHAFDPSPQTWAGHLSYLTDLATYYWPWLPLWVYGSFLLTREWRKGNETAILLLSWCLIMPVTMSFMNIHFMWYLNQCFPAFALVSAYALGRLVPTSVGQLKLTKIFLGVCLLVTILLNFLPFPLDRDRERDTRILAPYVKHFAEGGAKVIALREDFYGLNNALLFFSDHAANPLYSNAGEMAPDFSSKGLVLCVAHHSDLEDLKTLKGWYPVKYGEDMILIANQKLDTADVKIGPLN